MFYGPLSGPIQAANAGAILLGEAADDLFGTSVAAGDVNGRWLRRRDRGRIGPGRWRRALRARVRLPRAALGTIPAGNADFVVTGSGGDEVGHWVATGDVNDDGVSDTLVGAPQFTSGAPGYAAVFSQGVAAAVAPVRAGRGRRRQRRLPAQRDGGGGADVAQCRDPGDRDRRRAHQPHRPRGADVLDPRRCRQLRHHRRGRQRELHRRQQLLLGGEHRGHAAVHALGHDGRGDHDPDGHDEDVDPSRRQQLRRGAADEPVLPLHRDAASIAA